MKKQKEIIYSRKDLDKDFPTEESCLEYIFKFKNPNHICPTCYKHKSFYRVSTRKCYSCSFCGHQIHPTAGTIFHKSSTLLRDWFYAIYLFSVSKNGVSAAELKRQLDVTYKTAWRIATSIRKLMDGDDTPLSGIVEIDETYVGGKAKNVYGAKKKKHGIKPKTIVVGMIERKGRVATRIVNHPRISEIMPVLEEKIKKGSRIYSDKNSIYRQLSKHGYEHDSVHHTVKEYVRNEVHTNSIESFWSLIKRSFDGTYHVVSEKYLGLYLSEFSFRYNHRFAPQSMFYSILNQL